jgi:hypothetical protein
VPPRGHGIARPSLYTAVRDSDDIFDRKTKLGQKFLLQRWGRSLHVTAEHLLASGSGDNGSGSVFSKRITV